jgi:hypothetical protein
MRLLFRLRRLFPGRPTQAAPIIVLLGTFA